MEKKQSRRPFLLGIGAAVAVLLGGGYLLLSKVTEPLGEEGVDLIAEADGRRIVAPCVMGRDGRLSFLCNWMPEGRYRLRILERMGATPESKLLAEAKAAIRIHAGKTLRLRCRIDR